MPTALLALALAALGGCGNPIVNDPPELVGVNGRGADADGFWFLDAPEGEVVRIELEISDPEGQDISVWWPYGPPGLDFEPDETAGTWARTSELDLDTRQLTLVLEDTGRDIGLSEWSISIAAQ